MAGKKQSLLEKVSKLLGYLPGEYHVPEDAITLSILDGEVILTLLLKGNTLHVRSVRCGSETSYDLPEDCEAGALARIIHCLYSQQLVSRLRLRGADLAETPRALAGNGKDFEEALMKEAKRLANLGVLTMSRYGTTAVMLDNVWTPVPSLPDFEGVRAGGAQFIIEAKVCTVPSFRMREDQIKQKQVKHMLRRHKFGVPCFVFIHFNERTGVTFYDPPFSVAIPVKPAAEMPENWPYWEKLVELKDKNTELPPLTREIAHRIGLPLRWFIPPRSKNAVPDLQSIICP